ncbi:hypothetical protein [Methylobacterium radiotolerans]|uniref:Uncharacterized protein n=2 Tax=Methylobacterium radiotolerans TaxID=31998 RepID=B1M8V6_METRJ|nr:MULTISPECIES: hypothetical protein [Methylobacterium]MBY0251213.1 hypothetical protein [Methylobacterium organophilum]MCX7333890.1 hypothetical protein [Hyphomicrobiales bacterium]ACB27931.1 conserved hypothetical protein [Methylobacterium radiotolerans JCM 2831]MDE3746525.1 hypothetical protein [Methylobacterium radiotolerans]ONF50472.1 hypothetical protein RSM1_03805 [Methylobacterium radiotolerans]
MVSIGTRSGGTARVSAVRAAAGACALILSSGPVLAQSAASRIDQPTAATLPPGVSTTKGGAAPADRSTGPVSPPSAISSSTDVMAGGSAGTDTGRKKDARTNPLDHLSPEYKR